MTPSQISWKCRRIPSWAKPLFSDFYVDLLMHENLEINRQRLCFLSFEAGVAPSNLANWGACKHPRVSAAILRPLGKFWFGPAGDPGLALCLSCRSPIFFPMQNLKSVWASHMNQDLSWFMTGQRFPNKKICEEFWFWTKKLLLCKASWWILNFRSPTWMITCKIKANQCEITFFYDWS